MRARPLLVGVFALLAGCASPARVVYRPVRTVPPGQSAVSALVVGPGDVPDLADAGGFVMGEVTAQSEGSSEDEIAEQAKVEATRRGGTHVVWMGDASRVDEQPNLAAAFAAVYSGQACDKGSGKACIDYARQSDAAPIRKHVAGGRFVVLRVPPDGWRGLRAEIRPQPRDAKWEQVERDYQKCRETVLNPELCRRGEK